jgi:hypothetical protein
MEVFLRVLIIKYPFEIVFLNLKIKKVAKWERKLFKHR